jgi:hypothetical protein
MTDFEINDEKTIVDRVIAPNLSDVQEKKIEDLDKIKTCISSKKYSLRRKRMIAKYRSFVDCFDISVSCFSQFHDHEKCFEVVGPKIDDRYISHIHIKKLCHGSHKFPVFTCHMVLINLHFITSVRFVKKSI